MTKNVGISMRLSGIPIRWYSKKENEEWDEDEKEEEEMVGDKKYNDKEDG